MLGTPAKQYSRVAVPHVNIPKSAVDVNKSPYFSLLINLISKP